MPMIQCDTMVRNLRTAEKFRAIVSPGCGAKPRSNSEQPGRDDDEPLVPARPGCGAQALVVGEDFRFGRDRIGDSATLRELAIAMGMQVAVLPPVRHEGTMISSSAVRSALAAGDVALAAALLGRPHRLVGTVVRGDGRGRQLGIPTANLGDRANQEPGPGVYAAWAEVDGQRLPAALNVGHLPTVGGARPLTVEAHLIDWSTDIYGHPLTFDLIARVRGEQRFDSIAALVNQIQQDVMTVKQLLAV